MPFLLSSSRMSARLVRLFVSPCHFLWSDSSILTLNLDSPLDMPLFLNIIIAYLKVRLFLSYLNVKGKKAVWQLLSAGRGEQSSELMGIRRRQDP